MYVCMYVYIYIYIHTDIILIKALPRPPWTPWEAAAPGRLDNDNNNINSNKTNT